jgi:hypothetical protein
MSGESVAVYSPFWTRDLLNKKKKEKERSWWLEWIRVSSLDHHRHPSSRVRGDDVAWEGKSGGGGNGKEGDRGNDVGERRMMLIQVKLLGQKERKHNVCGRTNHGCWVISLQESRVLSIPFYPYLLPYIVGWMGRHRWLNSKLFKLWGGGCEREKLRSVLCNNNELREKSVRDWNPRSGEDGSSEWWRKKGEKESK